ncbi:MAG TPA: hypothetical protein VHL11_10760 [Phototrophicaceae bacterium]|jgi:hypothetical protein|nr:hypothetical protein [Phototrophicaceae bacterium]
MKCWSKLQRGLYNLIAHELDFQIHCAVYRMDSERGSTDLPRYWITLNQDIIWDYPRQFIDQPTRAGLITVYPYNTDISAISDLIRAYIDTPLAELLTRHFEADYWGLVNILRATDRRIGQRRLSLLKRKIHNRAALKIIEQRLKLSE